MRATLTPKRRQLSTAFLIFVIFSSVTAAPLAPDKMKPEELVAKHLASIGPADALAAIKSRIIVGNATATTRLNAVKELTGPAQLASEGDRVLLAMIFNSTGYPYEKAGYDGEKLTLALWKTTGKRSALGDFLAAQDAVFKQGLIGGVLSSAWPLLNLSSKNPRLSYGGTKKINDRQVHELKYSPRKGGGSLQISLYFDAETFRHVRTEYQYAISARMGATPEQSISQQESRYKLEEEFSDFKTEGALTMPHTYRLRLTNQVPTGTQVIEWTVNFSQFVFDQEIGAEAFNVSASN